MHYISFDANGKPFISHSNGKARKHKYIAKIENADGVRYFYDDAALDAFRNRKSLADKDRAAFSESIDKRTGKKDHFKLHTDGRYGQILNKEFNAESALRRAKESLRRSTYDRRDVDDWRRAASEKRMAENEYQGLKGAFEDYRKDAAFEEEARKHKHRRGKF